MNQAIAVSSFTDVVACCSTDGGNTPTVGSSSLTAFFGDSRVERTRPGWHKLRIMKDQNYLELVRKIRLFLDDESSDTTQDELFREIKANPEYLSYLSKEKDFRTFIKRKLPRQNPSPELIHSIKSRIIQAEFQPLS